MMSGRLNWAEIGRKILLQYIPIVAIVSIIIGTIISY